MFALEFEYRHPDNTTVTSMICYFHLSIVIYFATSAKECNLLKKIESNTCFISSDFSSPQQSILMVFLRWGIPFTPVLTRWLRQFKVSQCELLQLTSFLPKNLFVYSPSFIISCKNKSVTILLVIYFYDSKLRTLSFLQSSDRLFQLYALWYN